MEEVKKMLAAILESQDILGAKIEGLRERQEQMEHSLTDFKQDVNNRFDQLESFIDEKIDEEILPLYKTLNIHSHKITRLEDKIKS